MNAITPTNEQSPSSQIVNSVITIQKVWRGYCVRRVMVSREIFELAKQYISSHPNLSALPKANCGKTPVYLPPNLPIVIKAFKGTQNIRRFMATYSAMTLCFKNGYTEFLEIPKARTYQHFSIEMRLPVCDANMREQIGLYTENAEAFTKAVSCFTGLLCQSIFPDILTKTHPYHNQDGKEVLLGRCDNIPLMLVNNIGKIALIDLGGFRVRDTKITIKEAVECAKTALYIFPHHYDTILQTVSRFCEGILQMQDTLKSIHESALKCNQDSYTHHRDFLLARIQRNAPLIPEINQEAMLKYVRNQLTSSEYREEDISFLINILHSKIRKEADCNQTPIYPFHTFVSSRCVTFDSHELTLFTSVTKKDNRDLSLLECILDALLASNEICYAKKYYNRSEKLAIRIHY